MKFWDTSALLPLLVEEPHSGAMQALMRDDPAVAVWWLTPVEAWAALARLEREHRLRETDVTVAGALLDEARRQWTEIPPLDRVRDQAVRLVRLHPLRSADALQLAAAVVLADFDPRTLPFVTLDAQLASAARREGFEVITA
ncbi:MAG: type II toxin-antitoxin system VapC family toxin [Gemmatimonadales bacterium]